MAREIIGQSKPVQEMLGLIRKVAQTKTNVLIIGESGTGKELVARMIHDAGPLAGKSFVPVNCGAIPENLIESEMFGHKKGSFTGAVSEKIGLFEVADGGTLFLDEVGELPLAMQVKMLRALQERIIRKVGGTQDSKVDVRIIAATNRDLEQAIKQGTFREDLYYRLNVIQVTTPPLRQRTSDIKLLVNHFIEKFAKRAGKKISGISAEALVSLEKFSWPGNIRELENVLERAVTLENSEEISLSVLPIELTQEGGGVPIRDRGSKVFMGPDPTQGVVGYTQAVQDFEKYLIQRALDFAQNDEKKAAERLKLSLPEFQAKRRK